MPLLPIISDCEIQDNRLAMVLADDDSVSAQNIVCPHSKRCVSSFKKLIFLLAREGLHYCIVYQVELMLVHLFRVAFNIFEYHLGHLKR